MILAGALLAACAGPADPGVVDILLSEPGHSAVQGVLEQSGRSITGGSEGTFELDVRLSDGRSRLSLHAGPMIEESGWDRFPWAARGGDVLRVSLPGARSDAVSERFLRRYGWRDVRARGCMHALAPRAVAGLRLRGVRVSLPDAAPVELWFDAFSGRLSSAITHADGGTIETRFDDWSLVGRGAFARKRTQTDPTGQETILIATTSELARRPDRPWFSSPIHHGQVAGPATVPFVLDRGDRGHIVIPVAINGAAARLIFDTGAANFLTPETAAQYGLEIAGGANIGGIGERSFTGGYTRVARLDVAGARLNDTIAMVAPLPEAATHPAPDLVLQGLSGSELLAAFETTIDYARRAVTFAERGTNREALSLSLASDGQSLYVEGSVDGRPGWFRLDTGDPGTVTLFPTFADSIGYTTDAPSVTAAGEAGGAYVSSPQVIADVAIAGIHFRKVQGEISGQSAGAFASRSTAGNLGAGLLSCFRITIDASGQRARFEPLSLGVRPSMCTGFQSVEENAVADLRTKVE